MSRWRPPRPKSSAYITPEGAEKLRAELAQLWKVERPQVTDAVHQAALNGDRSENGDYIYGKKRLREIDSRVRYLTKRLEDLKIIHDTPKDKTKIYFGAWVTLENTDAKEITYRIVGPDELNLANGYISVDSPLAKALIGKQVDDEISLSLGGNRVEYSVVAIQYQGHTQAK